MYDENAYRETYREVNPLQCVFERGVLRRCVDCSLAVRRNIAEREAVGCRQEEAHARCAAFKTALRHAAMFVLKIAHPDDPMPFVKELKLQCGGLRGLATTLGQGEVADVAGMLATAVARFGRVEALPYASFLGDIRSFEPRARH